MEFWVYENAIHRKARIHRADCVFCDHGRGIHARRQTLSGKWIGPFPGLDSAGSAARATRQSDVRPCAVCVGAANASVHRPSVEHGNQAAHAKEPGAWEWDNQEELSCALRLNWVPKGRVTLDIDGKVRLPSVPDSSGLYRFKTVYPDGRSAIYIGESSSLRRRFTNYRNPGPTQQTSLRINAWLIELLSSGGQVSVAIADDVRMTTPDGDAEADLSLQSVRRLFEQLAISMQHGSNIETLNR